MAVQVKSIDAQVQQNKIKYQVKCLLFHEIMTILHIHLSYFKNQGVTSRISKIENDIQENTGSYKVIFIILCNNIS